jgi:hypothetical protein
MTINYSIVTITKTVMTTNNRSEYPPAEPVALRLLVPQKAFSQPSEAKARTKAKAS